MVPALLPAVPASGWPNAKPENVSLGDASMDQDLRIPEDTHKTTWRWPSDEDRPSLMMFILHVGHVLGSVLVFRGV